MSEKANSTEGLSLPDRRFRRSERLTHRRQFDAVFQRRRSAAGAMLIIYGLRNELAINRLGLSVGRRLGNAVVRNRFKRLCREAFRLTKLQQPIGFDWVVVPKIAKNAERPAWTLDAFKSEMAALMRKVARSK